ncbi:hypothetical protein EYB26_002200 [Talaromyces marneffei]|uniref:uncharacterized protein n=1 Tax=Talaromyces marneffei TaxID=37727 RepID=UPI0012A8B1F4|nr:uncharacterized protein EYB26_002200 [Talaromyces marneffei]QGA14545.1 hypothetical protein EYB26_002200 [Talaromyces marneffei]
MPPERRRDDRSVSATSTPDGQAREYSCVSCKKRKTRCDRQSPCSKCLELGTECVPGVRAPYSYRKRNRGRPDSLPRPANDTQTNTPGFVQNLWHGLSDKFLAPQATEARTNGSPSLDPIGLVLPGSLGADGDLAQLYPSANHAFILWQKFLENVNPLSKVIHAPSVQPEVIKATTDPSSSSFTSLALLFSIYAAAIMSLTKNDVECLFGQSKEALQHMYTSGAQQALSSAGFMKATNMTLLQAFTIYLLATRHLYNSETMWFLTGLAVRMGQSLRLPQYESNISVFDMQMRRRLWWQILLIDGRAAQLAHSPGPIMLSSGLDFTLPSNLNDADISPSMTGQPIPHEGPTEILFCLLRYELGKFLNEQGSSLHSPSVSVVEKDRLIDKFEKHIERLYLRFCDPALPLHLMASGGARSAICKMRLMAHHPSQQHDTEDAGRTSDILNWSVRMVEYDVLGQSTELLRNFSWHLNVYFQLDAFVFMLIVLQSEHPGLPLVDKAWDLVSETYKYRQYLLMDEARDLHKQVQKLTLKSWEVYQLNRARHGLSVCAAPPIIQQLLQQGLTTNEFGEASGRRQPNGKEGVQSQTDIGTNRIGHGDDADDDDDDASNGLMAYLDNSVASSSYFDSMPSGWDLVPGWDISDWEYWEHLLRETQHSWRNN